MVGMCRAAALSLCIVYLSSQVECFHEDLRSNTITWNKRRDNHKGSGLTNATLDHLHALDDSAHFRAVLAPLMVPRVPGTPQHRAVRQHIASALSALGWSVSQPAHSAHTPLGDRVFTNIIATLDPAAPRRLVLACHYDSLETPSGKFVGATDSAVPCAQLINLAYVLRRELAAHRDQGNEVTLQLIFFDGEEAMVSWTNSDSIYGAKKLAATLEQEPYTETGARGVSNLHRMDMFVLLDLLGTASPTFYSYFRTTEPWYVRLMAYELHLRSSRSYRGQPAMFLSHTRYNSGIQDDHLPFWRRGVPILHIIPSPFPRVWHKDSDNGLALHWDTIANQNTLWRALVADYLHLTL